MSSAIKSFFSMPMQMIIDLNLHLRAHYTADYQNSELITTNGSKFRESVVRKENEDFPIQYYYMPSVFISYAMA